MNEKYITDKEYFIKLLSEGKGDLSKCADHIKDDKDIAYYSVLQNSNNYLQVSDRLKSDIELSLTALKKDVDLYLFMPECIKSNRDVVKIAVSIDPKILQYSPEIIKSDFDIIKDAVKRNGYCLNYATKNLRNNKELILLGLETYYSTINISSYYYRKKFTNDEQFLLDAINSLKKGGVYDEIRFVKKFASDRIKKSIGDNQLPTEYFEKFIEVNNLKDTLENEMRNKERIIRTIKTKV